MPAFAAFEISLPGDALLNWATDKCMDGLTHLLIYLKTTAIPGPEPGATIARD